MAERIPFAFRSKPAAYVLDDRDVTRRRHSISCIHTAALVIRSALEQDRIVSLGAWPVDIRAENGAVPHRSLDAVLDYHLGIDQWHNQNRE